MSTVKRVGLALAALTAQATVFRLHDGAWTSSTVVPVAVSAALIAAVALADRIDGFLEEPAFRLLLYVNAVLLPSLWFWA